MFNSAIIARDMAKTSLPNLTVEVLDCTTAAAGMGLVALVAARVSDAGKALSHVTEAAKSVMSRVNPFAMLDTLHYLVKSGRVPQVAALVN
jgi:fatty acid-binding protein DegV